MGADSCLDSLRSCEIGRGCGDCRRPKSKEAEKMCQKEKKTGNRDAGRWVSEAGASYNSRLGNGKVQSTRLAHSVKTFISVYLKSFQAEFAGFRLDLSFFYAFTITQ